MELTRITREQIVDWVTEVGDWEKEHRRGATFYTWINYTFTSDDVESYKKDGIDASELLDVVVNLNGTWDDDWGFELSDITYHKVIETKEFVPEKIIPAHYISKFKNENVDLVFE